MVCRQYGIRSLAALFAAAFLFVLSGAARASDLDVDYLTCEGPSQPPLPSGLFDKIATDKLASEAFWETDSNALTRYRQRVLAERYENGVGTKRDLKQAIKHYRYAAFASGPSTAVYSPGFGSVPGSVSVSSPGGKSAGDPIALRRLGEMYRDGIGMEADPKRGQILLDCAAKLTPPAPARQPAYFDQFTERKLTPAPAAPATLLEREVRTFSFPRRVMSLAWSPDGKYLAVSHTEDRRITLVEVSTGRELWTAKKLDGDYPPPCCRMAFSPDGALLYTASAVTRGPKDRDKTVSVLSTRDGNVVRTFGYHEPRAGYALAKDIALSRDGKSVFAMPGMTNEIVVHDSSTGEVSGRYVARDDWYETGKGFARGTVALDEDRGLMWFVHEGMAEAWRLKGDQALFRAQAASIFVSAMAINPRTGELVTGATGGVMQARYPYNVSNGEIRTYADDLHACVHAIDPDSGKINRTYLGPGGGVDGLSVSPDGTRIAASKTSILNKEPAWLLLWDAASGKLLAAKRSSDSGAVAFAPNGRVLAIANGSSITLIELAPKPE
jgi:WD40 repeat protein